MASEQLDMFAGTNAAGARAAARAEQLVEIIATRADPDGWARLSRRRLAVALGCGLNTARRALAQLHDAGRIDIDYDRDAENPRSVLGYKLRPRRQRAKGGRRV